MQLFIIQPFPGGKKTRSFCPFCISVKTRDPETRPPRVKKGLCKVSCGFGFLCGKGENYRGTENNWNPHTGGAGLQTRMSTESRSDHRPGIATRPIPVCNHPQTSLLFRYNLILPDMRARHAGLKTRAPSSPLCTDGISFLFCQPKSINIDFALRKSGDWGSGLESPSAG